MPPEGETSGPPAVAVLGLGLIGGSAGLAVRSRLGSRVSGFDPDPSALRRAEELGAIDSGAPSAEAACEGVDVVVCSAPVGALPDLVGTALSATGPGVVVTDVGSTKRSVVERHAGSGRFVGGHPIAGAETSGVENARADLFEGARWYLTPTPATSGVLYDRLQRLVAGLGARPQAIDAAAHDRILASVSHLPHVVANSLVEAAAASLAGGSDRLPGVGPSFRDATRVAGANPAMWRDIFLANSEAVCAEIDGLIARLGAARETISGGDPEAIEAWVARAREGRRRLLEEDLAGGPVHELRVSVPNEPGVVARIALALGEARLNIEDMALYPTADGKSGAVALWVAGERDAERAREVVAGLGFSVSREER